LRSSKTATVASASRRDFLKASAATLAAACPIASASPVHAAGSDRLRIGLVGFGGRGTGAVVDCITSSKGVEIVAMGDLFKDRLDGSFTALQQNIPAEALRVRDDQRFVGFDAYKKVLACDIDIVLLATPAHFRPLHLKAAIEAGKHAFIEKPVAVDPVGARSIIVSAELAAKKNLGILAGTQRHHDAPYRDILGRVHDGAIGQLVGAQCYWMRNSLWIRERLPILGH
jgi:predicted dehydrogenase